MDRVSIVNRIGTHYYTCNTEGGEWSYVNDAGTKNNLIQRLGHNVNHCFLDLRFEKDNVAVLIETKQNFTDSDAAQLKEYAEEEKALHPQNEIICILANTTNDNIRVWKSSVDDEHLLASETVLDTMEHYQSLLQSKQ